MRDIKEFCQIVLSFFEIDIDEPSLITFKPRLSSQDGYIQVDRFSDGTYSLMWKLETNRYVNFGDRIDYLNKKSLKKEIQLLYSML